jgi:hypothetical protein
MLANKDGKLSILYLLDGYDQVASVAEEHPVRVLLQQHLSPSQSILLMGEPWAKINQLFNRGWLCHIKIFP